MKIVVNRCFGGFSVSKAVYDELGLKWDNHGFLSNKDFGIDSDNYEAFRNHPGLISAIEKVGEAAASGDLAELCIVEIPDDVEWYIHEYDGNETIHEKHRTW